MWESFKNSKLAIGVSAFVAGNILGYYMYSPSDKAPAQIAEGGGKKKKKKKNKGGEESK